MRALDMFIPVAQRRTCCFSRSHTRLYERRSTLAVSAGTTERISTIPSFVTVSFASFQKRPALSV